MIHSYGHLQTLFKTFDKEKILFIEKLHDLFFDNKKYGLIANNEYAYVRFEIYKVLCKKNDTPVMYFLEGNVLRMYDALHPSSTSYITKTLSCEKILEIIVDVINDVNVYTKYKKEVYSKRKGCVDVDAK